MNQEINKAIQELSRLQSMPPRSMTPPIIIGFDEQSVEKTREWIAKRVRVMYADDARVLPMTPGENTDPAYYDPATGEIELDKPLSNKSY